MAETKKAAIYTRISLDRSGKHQGVERQREDCELMCKMHEWEVVSVFEDNSVSAYSGKERAEYERMVDEYREGKFDVIVAWKLDRLTRSVNDFAEMLKELRKQHLRICTGDLGFVDLSTADARFTTQILVNVAEFESARKSERIKRANLQRARQGRIKPGHRCFGYGRNFEVIPDEADLVRRIYDTYLAGASMTAIAKNLSGELDTLGLPHWDAPSIIFAREAGKELTEKQKKKKFDLPAVQNILGNPRYAGYVAYAPTINGKCQPTSARWVDLIMRDEKTGEPIDAVWEAIVDRDKWWKVQNKRRKNKFKRNGQKIDRRGNVIRHIGSGFFRCCVCGEPVMAGDKTYVCVGHISRERRYVDMFVTECALLRLSMLDSFDAAAFVEPTVDTSGDDEAELVRLRGRLEQIRLDYKRQLIDGDLYHEVHSEVMAQIESIEARQHAALPAASRLRPILNAHSPVEDFLAITDAGVRRQIIQEMMDVTLMKHLAGRRYNADTLTDDVQITWKLLPDPERFLIDPETDNPRHVRWKQTRDGKTYVARQTPAPVAPPMMGSMTYSEGRQTDGRGVPFFVIEAARRVTSFEALARAAQEQADAGKEIKGIEDTVHRLSEMP